MTSERVASQLGHQGDGTIGRATCFGRVSVEKTEQTDEVEIQIYIYIWVFFLLIILFHIAPFRGLPLQISMGALGVTWQCVGI